MDSGQMELRLIIIKTKILQ